MPQGDYVEEHIKRHGRQLDYEERVRKREARQAHKASVQAQSTHGIKAKLLHQKRYAEKVTMKKRIKQHEERDVKGKPVQKQEGARPTYLLDREESTNARALSSAVKDRRKEKAAKFAVPLPKVRGVAEDEVFKVIKTGKRKQKGWKRMVTKATFVGEGFTRKPVKLERFIRPMALRYKKANVTHPELKATFQLPIKKNPNSPMYTQLGVITKGTVIEVNVSELGLVTTAGKVVWCVGFECLALTLVGANSRKSPIRRSSMAASMRCSSSEDAQRQRRCVPSPRALAVTPAAGLIARRGFVCTSPTVHYRSARTLCVSAGLRLLALAATDANMRKADCTA